jgi:hypothetical protein
LLLGDVLDLPEVLLAVLVELGRIGDSVVVEVLNGVLDLCLKFVDSFN